MRFIKDVESPKGTPVAGEEHSKRIRTIIDMLGGVKAVAVSEIGHMPEKMLLAKGIAVVITDSDSDIAAMEAASAALS